MQIEDITTVKTLVEKLADQRAGRAAIKRKAGNIEGKCASGYPTTVIYGDNSGVLTLSDRSRSIIKAVILAEADEQISNTVAELYALGVHE